LIKELKAQLTTLMRRDPKTADQKPYTSNPDITPEAILSNMAFIIKVKRPRLRILIGSVKIIKIGRKKAFKMPRIAAANKAVKKPFTCIPSITYEANMMAAVSINHRIKIPFILFFSSFLSFFNYSLVTLAFPKPFHSIRALRNRASVEFGSSSSAPSIVMRAYQNRSALFGKESID
jgi:hypothetical protein